MAARNLELPLAARRGRPSPRYAAAVKSLEERVAKAKQEHDDLATKKADLLRQVDAKEAKIAALKAKTQLLEAEGASADATMARGGVVVSRVSSRRPSRKCFDSIRPGSSR